MSDDLQPRCPNCRSCQVIPLLGTLPGAAPYDTVDLRRIPVGECVTTDVEAQWQCAECGARWGGEEGKSEA